jgi:transcriptional regulator with XRE-family HTH domain
MVERKIGAERDRHPIDILVGSRVRLRRKMLGMSQKALGERFGMTFQQVQKYESGIDRIGASRLHALSQILEVPVAFFFDQPDMVADPVTPEPSAKDEPAGRDLIDAYYALPDPRLRRALVALARRLGRE